MRTIDDLISEGKKFEIKTQPEYATLGGNGMQIHPSYEYVDNGAQYFSWQEICKRFIAANYSKNDKAISNFDDASKIISRQNHLKLISILVALREIPEPCIKNTPNNMEGITINVTQNQQQNQTQSQNFELFMTTIKSYLSSEQFQELQTIINENPKIEEAQPKITEKLKSFGRDVLSNIIANIITSPTIWSGQF